MKRQVNRLSSLAVTRAKDAGMYPDGQGLYLRIADDGGRGWVFRYTRDKRTRYMGLGAASVVTLAEAREAARDARALLRNGVDPIDAKAAKVAARRAEKARAITFKAAASAYVDAHKAGWRNEKHGDQWTNTLSAYAYPTIGDLPVQDVDVGLVVKILTPIWATKTETANRVRGRIESVLDWATVRGYRTGDNPARWRGHLETLLPRRSKVQKVKHHSALPYGEAPAFLADLKEQAGVAARAFEFLIFTATRTGETIGARWSEVDLRAGVWTIPADRIKAGKEHRVPLSARAKAIAKEMLLVRPKLPNGELSPWVFAGARGKHLSNNAILALLKRMERSDITAHGFRSTFKDWAAEKTNFPNEVTEMALAHVVEDKVEAAYRRGDLFEKRERLMDAWAGYLTTQPTKKK